MVATVPSMIGHFNMDNIHILLDMGYEVDVAADFADTNVWSAEKVQAFKEQLAELNIKYFQLDFSRDPLKVNRHAASYKEAVELIGERRYSYIHTHTPIASAIIRLAAHKTGTKVIYTAHGFHFFTGAPKKNWLLYYPVELFLSRWTDMLITINKEDYQRARKRFHAKRTEYIPGVGVDTKKFAARKVDKEAKRRELGVKNDDFLLLSVGELSENKNQKLVIDALGKLKAVGKLGNIVYLAVGKGDQRGELERLIKEYGIADHTKLLGYRTDVDELCASADCFVHPSKREGFGIAPLEAMAAGLPLIVSAIRGPRDFTEDGVSGCCIDPADVDAMVAAITRMRDDAEFRNRCAGHNIVKAKEFDVANTNSIMKGLYMGVA